MQVKHDKDKIVISAKISQDIIQYEEIQKGIDIAKDYIDKHKYTISGMEVKSGVSIWRGPLTGATILGRNILYDFNIDRNTIIINLFISRDEFFVGDTKTIQHIIKLNNEEPSENFDENGIYVFYNDEEN